MDRIINVKVGGNHISKDSKNAGVRGEGNVTNLRITFDEGWDEYAKTVIFVDAQGNNPVKRVQGVDLLEDIINDTRTYVTTIPPEPLAIAGEMTFIIEGYLEKKVDGVVVERKRQRSISDKLTVKYAPDTDNATEPPDPTPEPYEQLQGEIDKILNTIQEAATSRAEAERARDDAENANTAAETARNQADGFANIAGAEANRAIEKAEEASESAERAEEALGKTNYIGENGNWFAWDSFHDQFYDTGVKAQSGSTVYVGDNPPENADVWIDPDGGADGLGGVYAPTRSYINILGGIDNWETEEVTDSSGKVIGSRYGQVVNVNNAVITPNSKVDLQISSEQMVVFYEKSLAFVAENDNGVVTVFCIGQVPENNYTIQAVVTEVTANE